MTSVLDTRCAYLYKAKQRSGTKELVMGVHDTAKTTAKKQHEERRRMGRERGTGMGIMIILK